MAGQLRLAGAEVEGPGKRRYLFERAEAGLSYAAGRLALSADLLYEGNAVRAAGSVPVRLSLWPARMELGTSGLNLTLRSENAELAPLAAALVPKAEVSGRLSATVAATGDPRQPDFEGRATVQDAAVRAPGLPQGLRNIQGQVAFNRDRLVIEHMSADTEGGRAQLRGRVGLRAEMPLDLTVEARRFRVSLPEQSGWARVNADLTLTGSRLNPTVEGTIDVEEARVSIPERLTPSLREIRVVETLEELQRPERRQGGVVRGLERSVAVDVLVLAERRVWVRGRGLEAEFALNLDAVKEREGSLRIVGTADVIRGNYSLRGKRLAIERGQALFRGLPSPDPDLSARLTYEVQQTTVVIILSGTLSKPEIQITSEPPMDQTNVYSYLFFGRPADKLGRGEGTVLQQQVASLLGGAAAQELTGVLGQEFALDTFELTPAEGELGIEAVSLGKYLTRDLFVTFERSFGLEAENRVRIDYRLSKWFSLESQFGSERTTGFDLFWNYDFSYLTK
jgi:autotransporter translocation and assembly factor TamB